MQADDLWITGGNREEAYSGLQDLDLELTVGKVGKRNAFPFRRYYFKSDCNAQPELQWNRNPGRH